MVSMGAPSMGRTYRELDRWAQSSQETTVLETRHRREKGPAGLCFPTSPTLLCSDDDGDDGNDDDGADNSDVDGHGNDDGDGDNDGDSNDDDDRGGDANDDDEDGDYKKHLLRAYSMLAGPVSNYLHISFYLIIRIALKRKSDYCYFQKELKLRGECL